jgi:arylsulfatase A-like enzyme/tetratricopeptide (TPR) repeat protein
MQLARRFLFALSCIAFAGCGAGDEPAPEGRAVERIVLVTIDTLRADHVGSYGAEGAETPALDALAAEGARFETAIAPAAITLPSHATLLTGRDPPQHGVRHNGFFRLPPDVVTLAEHLRGAGFASAAFVSAFVLDSRFGLDRGFDVYDDRLGMRNTTRVPGAVPDRRGDRTVDAALAWLGTAPARFLLWVHLYDPHAEYEPPPPFAERFAGRPYDGEIAFADAQLARLRAAVAERWPTGGTLWWVTADHGESLGEHDEKTHSYGVYDATQHVPLLTAGPGVPSGKLVRGVVALADVTPTLLEQAGLPPLPGASGVSLVAALRGTGNVARSAAWVETLATQLDMGWSPLLGVRTAQHKYVRAPEPELFDLSEDPHELTNRAALEPERVAELDRLVGEQAAGRPVVPSHRLDAVERAQLEALGYLKGGASPSPSESLGEVGGLDPKRGVAELAKVDRLALLSVQRRGDEALALYDEIESRGFPVLLLGAGAALRANQPERALREARIALALIERLEPLITIGDALTQLGRLAEARQSYERAAALDPENASAWLGLGYLAELEGQPDEAAQHYEHVRTLPIPSPEALWRLAALHIETGRRGEARALLAEVPQAELRVPGAADRLARAERSAGNPELARTRLEGSLREFPSSEALWLLDGELLDQQGDLQGALSARREALRLAPDRADALNAVAWTLARLGRDLLEAEQYAESAIRELGRRPALLDTLALVRLAQGRHGAALALADEGLPAAQKRDRVDLQYRRAEALAGLGRGAEAKEALTRASEEAAAQPPAWNTWSEAEQRVRRLLAGPA